MRDGRVAEKGKKRLPLWPEQPLHLLRLSLPTPYPAATCRHWPATMHGAFLSGLREVRYLPPSMDYLKASHWLGYELTLIS